MGAYGNHLFTECYSTPLKQYFVLLRPLYNTMKKHCLFSLTWEPSKGLARCRQFDLCTTLQPTARLTNSLSPSWLCIKHNALWGRTSPIVWAGCGPEHSVTTLCLLSSPPSLPWEAAEKDFWSLLILDNICCGVN